MVRPFCVFKALKNHIEQGQQETLYNPRCTAKTPQKNKTSF